MKVLLDENFPLPLLAALRGAGIAADHIISLKGRSTPIACDAGGSCSLGPSGKDLQRWVRPGSAVPFGRVCLD